MPRSLYNVDPNTRRDHYLPVGQPLANGQRHTLFITELGNPLGFPVVFFHGGPGDGCNVKKAGNFNPQFYRIILVDQRGAGLSTPAGCLEQNTTADLLADMQAIRQFLKIDQWVIAGSSWGSTLALLYAEKYPEAVAALVLRGTFLARKQDMQASLEKDSLAAIRYPFAWNHFKSITDDLLAHAELPSFDSYTAANYALLTQGKNDTIITKTAENLILWNSYCLGMAPLPCGRDFFVSIDDIQKLIIQLSYIINDCYLSDNQILKNLAIISQAKIPVHIIHGQHDLICPLEQAEALIKALPNNLVTYNILEAGHISMPVTEEAMVNATDKLLHYLRRHLS